VVFFRDEYIEIIFQSIVEEREVGIIRRKIKTTTTPISPERTVEDLDFTL